MVGNTLIIFVFLNLCRNQFLSAIFPSHDRNNVNRHHFISCNLLNLFPISSNFIIELSSDDWQSPDNIFLCPFVLQPFLSSIFLTHDRNNVKRYNFILCMCLNMFPISTNFNIEFSSDSQQSPDNIFLPPSVLWQFFVRYFFNTWQKHRNLVSLYSLYVSKSLFGIFIIGWLS